MAQKPIAISVFASVAVAGILIMAILANQAYSISVDSTAKKCKITQNRESCKTKTTTPPPQGAKNGNAAQGASTTGNAAHTTGLAPIAAKHQPFEHKYYHGKHYPGKYYYGKYYYHGKYYYGKYYKRCFVRYGHMRCIVYRR
jgi:hypothetical protein